MQNSCPRCGSTGKYIGIFGHYEGDKRAGYFCGCWKCGLKTKTYKTKEEAQEAWKDMQWPK